MAIHIQSLLDNGDQLVSNLSRVFVNLLDITLTGRSRPNNIGERWNTAFVKLVVHAHPTIWKAIDSLHKDQALFATALFRDRRGDSPTKCRRRHTVSRQTLFRNEPGYQENSRGFGRCCPLYLMKINFMCFTHRLVINIW